MVGHLADGDTRIGSQRGDLRVQKPSAVLDKSCAHQRQQTGQARDLACVFKSNSADHRRLAERAQLIQLVVRHIPNPRRTQVCRAPTVLSPGRRAVGLPDHIVAVLSHQVGRAQVGEASVPGRNRLSDKGCQCRPALLERLGPRCARQSEGKRQPFPYRMAGQGNGATGKQPPGRRSYRRP